MKTLQMFSLTIQLKIEKKVSFLTDDVFFLSRFQQTAFLSTVWEFKQK